MSDEDPTATRAGTAAQALLAATNRFIGAGDAGELAAIVVETARSIFGAWKASLVLFDGHGGRALAAGDGYTPAEIDRIHEALAGSPLVEQGARGEEWWSADPGPLRDDGVARLARYGARSGFGLPVRSPDRLRGIVSVLFQDERTFEPSTRDTARSFAAQVGLALELIGARDDLRAKTRELEHQTAVTRALFEVSQQLATVASPDEVPDALGSAVRAATGASISLVGRWDPASGRVIFVTADGVPEHLRQRIADLEATPERFSMIRGGMEGRANVRVPPFDPTDLPVDLAVAMGLTAIAGAPIIVGGRTWGVIAVATREGDPSIVESGVELLGGMASIAASAIGRAEAAALLERQADVLESTVAERTIQLRQAVDELTLANQARTEFLANVSHELRTPLTAILGFTDVLLSGLDGPMTNVQLDDLRTIDASGRHLLALIDDLIDVSRIDAGRLELRVEAIDLEALLANAVDEVRALAEAKGLALSASLERLPAAIAADPVRVHEILQNLLSNAVKFTPTGGSVALHATTDEDRGAVRIVVEDTGIGVAAEHQERIFDKFHRVAGPEYGGTGLGLAIARQYAERHGGSLTVESTPGLGSRFTVILPVDGPSPAAEDVPA